MTNQEINQKCKDFASEYGELLLLKANIVAINNMLIGRGKEEELYNEMTKVMDKFREKVNKE